MKEIDPKPFLPSKNEIKAIVGELFFTVMHMAYHFVWLVPLALLWIIPQGDQFAQVAPRLLLVLLCLVIGGWLLKHKRANYLRLFKHIVSEQTLNFNAPPVEPKAASSKAAITENWYLVIVAVLMLPMVSGAIDFNTPWAVPGNSRGKYSWVAPTLEWFRMHSNTTRSLAWLFLVVSLSFYAYRLRRGMNDQTMS